MSYSKLLAKPRTVRFSLDVDKKLSAIAASKGMTVSEYEHCDSADTSIIAASERLPRLQVLTTDRKHFATYRRSDGLALPLSLPEDA